MKKQMNQLKTVVMNLWADEEAQGATEYILLLVVIVAVATAFKGPMMSLINAKMSAVSGSVSSFGGDSGTGN